jgi:hypothetical protein
MNCKRFVAPLLLAAGVGSFAVQPVSAAVEVGLLTCESVPGTRLNLLIRSTVDVRCVFERADGTKEHYKGETGIALGLDLSFKEEETIAFSVIAASNLPDRSHPLAGRYVGGRASVALGQGIGAAALIGGSEDHIGLNPLALEGSRGIGVAGGLGFLYIEADR